MMHQAYVETNPVPKSWTKGRRWTTAGRRGATSDAKGEHEKVAAPPRRIRRNPRVRGSVSCRPRRRRPRSLAGSVAGSRLGMGKWSRQGSGPGEQVDVVMRVVR